MGEEFIDAKAREMAAQAQMKADQAIVTIERVSTQNIASHTELKSELHAHRLEAKASNDALMGEIKDLGRTLQAREDSIHQRITDEVKGSNDRDNTLSGRIWALLASVLVLLAAASGAMLLMLIGG